MEDHMADDTKIQRILLTAAEAAKQLGITRGSLEGLRRRGNGPNFTRGGKHIFYDQIDITAWASEKSAAALTENKNKGVTNRVKDLTLHHPEFNVEDQLRVLREENYDPKKSTVRAFRADCIDVIRRATDCFPTMEAQRKFLKRVRE